MPNAAFGRFDGPKTAINAFVYERIEAVFLRSDAPPILNIIATFAEFLCVNGAPTLAASEAAEKQFQFTLRKIVEVIGRWHGQGLRAPMNLITDHQGMLAGWGHDRHLDITGHHPVSHEFIGIYQWISSLTEREFLLPVTCFLKLVGCDSIFVTDGSGDEGVDCSGRIGVGALRSIVLFVQAKSKVEMVPRDLVLQEYGKYSALPRTPKFTAYLNALGVDHSIDGAAYNYVIIASNEFHPSAQQVSARLGVLLRSRRQLAFFLSEVTSLAALEALHARKLIPSRPDLSTNLAPLLDY